MKENISIKKIYIVGLHVQCDRTTQRTSCKRNIRHSVFCFSYFWESSCIKNYPAYKYSACTLSELSIKCIANIMHFYCKIINKILQKTVKKLTHCFNSKKNQNIVFHKYDASKSLVNCRLRPTLIVWGNILCLLCRPVLSSKYACIQWRTLRTQKFFEGGIRAYIFHEF